MVVLSKIVLLGGVFNPVFTSATTNVIADFTTTIVVVVVVNVVFLVVDAEFLSD